MVGTLPPFAGSPGWSAGKERERVNAWIRARTGLDGVVDFDRALRDPARPTRLAAAYDSGDHLHPGDRGYAAMAQAVDLSLIAPPQS